jgi:hypothetical protein
MLTALAYERDWRRTALPQPDWDHGLLVQEITKQRSEGKKIQALPSNVDSLPATVHFPKSEHGV